MIISVLVLAHPLTEASGPLPLPPVFTATLAVCAVAGAARIGNTTAGPMTIGREDPARRLGPLTILTRTIAVALLLLVIIAGRFGDDEQLNNLAPPLLIGLVWPLLLLASAVLGRVWPRIDPWDTLARLVAPFGGRSEPARDTDDDPRRTGADVIWAVPLALVWTWYLSVYPSALEPGIVGGAISVYTIVTLAGCLAVGRQTWLSRAEVFGLLFSWIGRLRGGRLATWAPPRGAELVLGVLAGGLIFGVVRISRLWGATGAGPQGRWFELGGLAVCAAAGVVLLRVCDRRAGRLGSPGAVTAAAVPVVAAIGFAVALSRNRLTNSVQLLVRLVSDPLGQGWDLFGTAEFPVYTALVSGLVRVLAQVAVLLAGGVLGVLAVRRRAGRAHPTVVFAVSVLVGSGVLAVTAV